MPEPLAIALLVKQATDKLSPVHSSARLDAEVLLGWVLKKPRPYIHAFGDEPLTDAQYHSYTQAIEQRANGQPVAYITGEREFWSLTLSVSKDTLIPRADSETLVSVALARLVAGQHYHIADLGTGSGAIAIAIASERPACSVTACDVSAAAVAVARSNAERHDVSNVICRHSDWFDGLTGQRFHLLVSNPPYIARHDKHLSQGDVRFEPAMALVGGVDGLDAIRHLVAFAPRYLIDGGQLILEHGYDQGASVRELMAARGYMNVRTHLDLAGHERVTEGSCFALA